MAQKNVAQEWLTQAQASPQAWHFCWALLSPDKVPEIQFFGASTLHTKISRHWTDLPAEQHESLRSQLIAQVGHFSCGPKMVLTRLCVALASLILHTLLDSWTTAVPDLLRAFQGGEGSAEVDIRYQALLEVLVVLPEELQTRKLSAERRAQLQSALTREWSSLCPLLRQILRREEAAGPVKERVLRCLVSWLALDVDLGESEGLLQDSFTLLREPELFDTAVETIVSTISQHDSQRFADSLLKMLPQVLALQEQLTKAVQDRDMETSHGICRIAVALGETHCRALLEQVDHWQGFQALVNMILSCTGMPGHYPVDETSSSLTLTFWYTLQDDIMSLDTEKQTLYLQVYRPLYFQLVEVLLHKARFPSDPDFALWSADDKEQFRIYRVDISDTLMYVYELLGPELLRNLYDKLGVMLTDKTHPSSWQDIEALLFGFQSIAETVDISYSDVIPGLLGLIPLITADSIHLAETIMLTIGSLAEWLADHPLMLPGVLRLVLQTLSNADLSVATVSTLKRICRECRHSLRPHANDILTALQEVLVKQIHKSTQSMWLMQALGYLLSSLPDEEVLGKLLSLLSPHIQQLERLANEMPSPASKLSTVHILGLLSSLFSTLDLNAQGEGQEDVRAARSQPRTNPVSHNTTHRICVQIKSESTHIFTVSQAACAVFEKSLKTLIRDFAPLVSQLCELIGQLFSAYPQACALDLTGQLVHVFACEKEHFPPITALLELVTSITMSMFQHGKTHWCCSANGSFVLQVLKRKADVYLSEGLDVKVVFYCEILFLHFFPLKILKEVSNVFQAAHSLIVCTVLICVCVQAVSGQSCSLLELLSEVFFSMSRHCPSLLSLQLRDALQPPGFPSALLTPEQKEHFCQQILR
uniref:Importin-13 n=1 Tax=Pygocentrus nattereri TaxID=42514 RepID=A0AAR2JS02_PYGNA